MMHILKCKACNSYGLTEKCTCGATRVKPKPPRYSPEDKYGEYRRQYKKGQEDDELEDQDSQEIDE